MSRQTFKNHRTGWCDFTCRTLNENEPFAKDLIVNLGHPNCLILIQLSIFVIGRVVRRRGPATVRQLQFVLDE